LDALGRVFFSSKYILRQSRGTFGLGGTMAILYAQATSGKPVKVITSTGDSQIVSYVFQIDIDRNRPNVIRQKTIRNRDGWRGTILELYLEGNYSHASRYIISYFKHTAAITPHAEITFIDPDGVLFHFKRIINTVPRPPKVTKPHPHGIDLETLKKMLNSSPKTDTIKEFLVNNFHRLGKQIARKFLRSARIKESIRIGEIDNTIIEKLYRALKTYEGFISPSADVLSPITERILMEGIKKEYNPDYIDVVTRPPSSYQGYPFIIEAALVYGGSLPGNPGEILLYRYANKIPLLFDEGSDVSYKVLNNINMNNYKRPTDKPTAIFIHLASTKIPFKTVGKEAIADIPEIEKEIELAIRYLLRRFTRYTRKIERKKYAEKRLKIFEKYLTLIGEYSSKIVEAEKPDVSKLIIKLEDRYKVKAS
jgi:DNA topoisomerase-6 subunit B